MERKPPLVLIVVAVLYLGLEAWLFLSTFSSTVFVRLGLSIALFYFALAGSRLAGNILGLLSAISAALLLVTSWSALRVNPPAAIGLAVVAVLLAAFSAYMFFGKRMRAFQDVTESDRQEFEKSGRR